MWSETEIPAPPAPIRAYTLVDDFVLFICTDAGVFALNLRGSPTWDFVADCISEYMEYAGELVRYDEYGVIVFRDTHSPLHGFPTKDSEGCSDIPLDEHPPTGDRLDFDSDTDTILVLNAADFGHVKFAVHPFGASPDNWATAGFSHDGNHLTVGNLERIRVFRYSAGSESRA